MLSHQHVWRFGLYVPDSGGPSRAVWMCFSCAQIETVEFMEWIG